MSYGTLSSLRYCLQAGSLNLTILIGMPSCRYITSSLSQTIEIHVNRRGRGLESVITTQCGLSKSLTMRWYVEVIMRLQCLAVCSMLSQRYNPLNTSLFLIACLHLCTKADRIGSGVVSFCSCFESIRVSSKRCDVGNAHLPYAAFSFVITSLLFFVLNPPPIPEYDVCTCF